MIATKKLKYSDYDLLVVGVASKQKFSKLIFKGSSIEDADKIWEVLNTLNTPCFLLDLTRFGHFIPRLFKIKNSFLIKR
ncbi:MAG TPA: hypothetical protein PLD48_08930 [Bacillota bacterium]|nr:hypothetical protein [Bacillota bacterium]HOK69666.1 hypothetical protein [Bacillota bacterium]HPP86020.1 hypothetical protein [Bacillota bacterium]